MYLPYVDYGLLFRNPKPEITVELRGWLFRKPVFVVCCPKLDIVGPWKVPESKTDCATLSEAQLVVESWNAAKTLLDSTCSNYSKGKKK